ncbi:RNA polymerase sigma factor [Nocardioides taihuensis]|uniref:RNA polymerase sigma factor n=1 Tax=Nocardioides taihuensis TaxID=1835606 RepID=A0ABW0BJU1_9ACTN
MSRDLDVAEECVQEAYAAAMSTWPRDGVPANPTGWLVTAARRRAVDVVRREQVLRSKLPLLVVPEEDDAAGDGRALAPAEEEHAIRDETLRLVFLCCHPALAPEAQLALTLRLVCGVETRDLARLFVVPQPTMAARLTRAKRKIATARIPFRVPPEDEWAGRLQGVLGVVYLLLTAGHAVPSGPSLVRDELADRALHLARTLHDLVPDEPEVRGLLALLLVTRARRGTRVDDAGRLVPLADQDRVQWDAEAVAEADALVTGALRAGPPGRYTLQAAIALLHAQAPSYEETDWAQIVVLYDALLAAWPSPVVRLNRAVALAAARGPEAALVEVDLIERGGELAAFRYLPAVRADLLARLGRDADAARAFEQAIALADNEVERDHLRGRLEALRRP